MNQGLDYTLLDYLISQADINILLIVFTLVVVILNHRSLRRIEERQRIKDILEKEKLCQRKKK